MSTPRTAIEDQWALLASWRKLLEVCLGLYDTLDPATRPPEVAVGVVQTRSAIAELKAALRQAGEDVDDRVDELTTADADTVTHQLRLLSTYRRNLTVLAQQKAQYAGQTPPPVVVNQLADVRRKVAEIKRRLRDWQVPVEDLPDDAETAA